MVLLFAPLLFAVAVLAGSVSTAAGLPAWAGVAVGLLAAMAAGRGLAKRVDRG